MPASKKTAKKVTKNRVDTKTRTKSATKAEKKLQMELKRAETLEFNVENSAQAAEICAHLKQLESTVGWIYLKRFLEDSMKVIERQIITKKDIYTGEKLDEEETDQLRMSYLAYEELVNKPEILIAQLSQGNRPTLPEYDPFAQDLRDRGEPYAGVLADDE